jgi:hypothetical protein
MTYTPQGHARFVRCACVNEVSASVKLVDASPWLVMAKRDEPPRHTHQYRPGHPAIGALCPLCGAPIEEIIVRLGA